MAEAAIDDPARGSRSVDVLLRRAGEIAVIEVFDWFDDVGAALRAWHRKLARVEARAVATAPPRPAEDEASVDTRIVRVSGCWALRATVRNRQLVSDTSRCFARDSRIRHQAGCAASATPRGRCRMTPDCC